MATPGTTISSVRPDKWTIGTFEVIFIAAVVSYLPAFAAGFVWNDVDYVTAPGLRSIGGLVRIWTELGVTQQYYPVLHSAFWLQHLVFADSPVGYHAVNILLHAICSCLLASTSQSLFLARGWNPRTSAITGLVAGLIFAVHPVYAESVAWISEQKNTLSLLFYLCAGRAYLRFAAGGNRRTYAAATALFLLALLSKSVTASLPAALLLVLWWQNGRLKRADWLSLLPWFAVGAAIGLLTAWVEHSFIGAHGADFDLSWPARLVLSGRVIWFYVWKYAWPFDLMFIYPRWSIDATQASQWVAVTLAAGVSLGAWLLRRRWRGFAMGWLFFVGSLFPVLGFFNVYAFVFSYVADHWNYLPSLGLLLPAAAALGRIRFQQAARVVVGILVLVLAAATWRQARLYHDMETFHRAAVERNPDSWMSQQGLGGALLATGQTEESIVHFRRATEIKPENEQAWNNLGIAYLTLRDYAEAGRALGNAIERKPDFAVAYFNLGLVEASTRQFGEANLCFERAYVLDPRLWRAHYEMGLDFETMGETAKAIASYETTLRDRPEHLETIERLAKLYLAEGRKPEAAELARRGAELSDRQSGSPTTPRSGN